jgi:hypothetical protein
MTVFLLLASFAQAEQNADAFDKDLKQMATIQSPEFCVRHRY